MKKILLASALFSAGLTRAFAQTPVVGGEFPVNTYTAFEQNTPDVASDHQDHYVITWTDEEQDFDIFARRYDVRSDPLGPPFRVNTGTAGIQLDSSVAADGSGNFVIVWTDDSGSDGSLQGIVGRRFDGSGSPIGSDFAVNSYTTSTQTSAEVAADLGGSFVVVWQSNGSDGSGYGIRGRRFGAGGAPLAPDFAINTYTTGRQSGPRVAAVPAGGFVVVWESAGQDGSSYGIVGRRYDGAGNGSPEFPVNGYTTGEQRRPDVAVRADGGFVVAWEGQTGPNDEDVFARRFDASGNPLGSDFPVSDTSPAIERAPRLAIDAENDTIVTWMAFGQEVASGGGGSATDGGQAQTGVYARRFGPEGQRIGPQFVVNVYTTGEQASPAIAAGDSGQFVVTWESYQDGSFRGIYGRSMNFPEARPMQVDQTPSGGASNVNGVLESGERVVVSPAYRNRSDTDLTLPGLASSLTGPAGGTYSIQDTSANYGTIEPDGTNGCHEATGNCYELTVAGTRPALHWDALLVELLDAASVLDAKKTWSLHVGGSFSDMTVASNFYPFVENLLHNGVTAGGGCGVGVYCPLDGVLRQQMAVFLLKSRYGPGYAPPAATGTIFQDVAASNPFAPWIEELFRQGVTGGCAGGPPPAPLSYCPTSVVTRQQMAAFLLRMREGSGYVPPACQQIFADVPCSNGFAPFIEALYQQQIAAGCSASPLMYCPGNQTTRQQMAAFLVKTFGLNLYGP